ncbi:MAG: hypothetical protein AAF518_07630 [Spirochaetota bacterium]
MKEFLSSLKKGFGLGLGVCLGIFTSYSITMSMEATKTFTVEKAIRASTTNKNFSRGRTTTRRNTGNRVFYIVPNITNLITCTIRECTFANPSVKKASCEETEVAAGSAGHLLASQAPAFKLAVGWCETGSSGTTS